MPVYISVGLSNHDVPVTFDSTQLGTAYPTPTKVNPTTGPPIDITHVAGSTTFVITGVWINGTDYQCVSCVLNVQPFGSPAHLGGPVQVRLWGTDTSPGPFAGFYAFGSRSSGYRVTDTAGFIWGQNTLTPSSRSASASGGINVSIDGARWFDLNPGQRLWFDVTGGYRYNTTTFGTSPLLPGVANAGSTRTDTYKIASSANYMISNYYLVGGASFDWSHVSETTNIGTPAQGSTDGRGYALGITAGKYIPLINSLGVSPQTVVKAPPTTPGGFALFLDVSGHYSYRWLHGDGFTDSTGFIFGDSQASYHDVGIRTRLMAVVPDNGFSWMPFIGVTADRLIGFNYTVDVPAQAATPANTFSFSPDTTFWGTEFGLEILTRNDVKFGVKGFYQTSADTQAFGGNLFVKIPFWATMPSATDSGIRIAASGGPSYYKAPAYKAAPLPALWNWTGLYFGAHVGGSSSATRFSDPFGAPLYGDTVFSPGFLGGGQVGYNLQRPGARWVLGLEADGSLLNSDGTNTCFAVSSANVNTTCRCITAIQRRPAT